MTPGYLCQPDGSPYTAETFDWRAYLADLAPPEVLLSSRGRKLVTRLDPLAFALIYMRRHLQGRGLDAKVTFADAHLGWARQAREWLRPVTEPRGWRVAEFAPRMTGKSTWWFLIIPTWAAAHGHARFVAAFADTATQAETHLATFRRELETNALLRADYPELCHPSRKANGAALADNTTMYRGKAGFVFAARGADTSSLGLKVDEYRPDVLIFDDIEPDEARYGPELVKKRKKTLQDAILPLNEYARVAWVGTTTRYGGLAHQLVAVANGEPLDDDDDDWIAAEKIVPRRWEPIITRDDGTERSLWPDQWSIEFLQSIRHTRSYAKNYNNEPVEDSSLYWTDADFRYLSLEEWEAWGAERTLMVIDPAVTDGKSSDWSAIAVLSWRPAVPRVRPAEVVVRHVSQVKKTGRPLRNHAFTIAQQFPGLRRIAVECNQGGLTWLDTMSGLPYQIDLILGVDPKHVRAADALLCYQQVPPRVWHLGRFPAAEGQMKAFPRAVHDDLVDVVSHGVIYLLMPDKIHRPKGFTLAPLVTRARVGSYR